MKIALAQINPTIGDLEGNLQRIQTGVVRAQELGADLVVFSEMVVSGYPCRDLLEKPEFIRANRRAVEQLIEQVRGPAVALGHFAEREARTGKRLSNAATVFQDGRVLARHEKILLPAYDVFDEMRYFEPGTGPVIALICGLRIGLTICEDIWNEPGFFDHDIYHSHPVTALKEQGVDLVLNLSASPFRMGRGRTRCELGGNIVRQTGVPFVLVNQVGGNDDLVFDGHSFALDAKGQLIARAPGFEEALVLADVQASGGGMEVWPSDEEEEIFNALVMGIRDYLGKCGFRSAVIGLSGGIDSSVVAVLAAAALGPENVIGVSMPSAFTSNASNEDARVLATRLGIRFETLPIGEALAAYKKTLKPLFGDAPEDVTEENLQARIRGNLLMALSNKWGSLVLSTGNKSELSVGYCTLYGDMAGGLAVISDVLKTRVYRLARWINREEEVIPHRVLERAPTAELRPNQTDQDRLPPYEVLDPILEAYVERHQSIEEIVAQGFEEPLVREVVALVDNNEYKRQQAAPGLKITGKAFGSGRRIPIAQRFRKPAR